MQIVGIVIDIILISALGGFVAYSIVKIVQTLKKRDKKKKEGKNDPK